MSDPFAEWDDHWARMQRQYGDKFKNKHELETFAKLPLGDKQRKELFYRMMKTQAEERKAAEEASAKALEDKAESV